MRAACFGLGLLIASQVVPLIMAGDNWKTIVSVLAIGAVLMAIPILI